MTVHVRKNLSFTDPACENGDEFRDCNLTQAEPNTAICAGKTGLIFTRCNLLNCTLPAGAVRTSGLLVQKSRCTNLHPDLADHVATPCAADCDHVTDTDEVWVDGVLIETVYTWEDTLL